MAECHKCDGTGYEETPCKRCKGTGFVWTKRGLDPCCGGYDQSICRECGGTGEVDE